MMKTNKTALITGATSGIGRATAYKLAQSGIEIVATGRREDQLKSLAQEINCEYYCVDLTSEFEREQMIKKLGKKIDIVINNAGLALGKDEVSASEWSDIQKMIDLNITAAIKICHAFTPLLIEKGEGDIINVCSVAGHWTYSGGAVYCATKHALRAFTQTLREETCGKNLRIMQVSPGMVETEFSLIRFKGDHSQAKQVYAGMTPLTADDIARQISFMLEQHRHVCIDEILSMPTDQGSPTKVSRKAPID